MNDGFDQFTHTHTHNTLLSEAQLLTDNDHNDRLHRNFLRQADRRTDRDRQTDQYQQTRPTDQTNRPTPTDRPKDQQTRPDLRQRAQSKNRRFTPLFVVDATAAAQAALAAQAAQGPCFDTYTDRQMDQTSLEMDLGKPSRGSFPDALLLSWARAFE
jgi:hypothetical protein